MKTYFCADVGLNHNGSFQRAYNAIMQAKQCGFDAVKFQVYEPDRLTADEDLRKKLRAGQFDVSWLPDIRQTCDSMQIDLAITPFYPEAVDIIAPYVDYIKIGSYEIGYSMLIKKAVTKAVTTDLPIIISTGMIEQPACSVWVENSDLILYCVSKYPCSINDIDMSHIQVYRKEFGDQCVGYSDHSHNPNVIWAALIAGASHIEMHFDTDGKGLEYPDGHVWLAAECFDLVHNIREAEKCFEPTTFVPDYSKRTDQNGRRN